LNRVDVINAVLERTGGETYLEIGVDYGLSFVRVKAERKVAVDPHFKLLSALKIAGFFFAGQAWHFEVTSDEFFEKHSSVFESHKIDVAFVDGLHTYQQSLRDCRNCLKYLAPGGVIVIHDCNPVTEAMARPVSSLQEAKESDSMPDWTTRWGGDVWKTVAHLRSTRPDMEAFVLDCDYGIGLVRRGSSESSLDYSEEEIAQMTYADLDADREALLGLKAQSFFPTFLDRLGPLGVE